MKHNFFRALLLVSLSSAQVFAGSANLSLYINPMIGTGNGGNTFPGPVWPMGMVQPSPDTSLVIKPHDHDPSEFSHALDYRSMCNGYDPGSDMLLGFTQTHLSMMPLETKVFTYS